jgi:hypothetical protein
MLMAGKSMEQRLKDGPLKARWKAAQSKSKALEDRKYAEIGKLLDGYDDVVQEYKAGAADRDDLPGQAIERINAVLRAYVKKNDEVHTSMGRLTARFRKSLAGLAPSEAKVNLFGALFEETARKRKSLFSAHVANDRATSGKIKALIEEMAAGSRGSSGLQGDLVSEGEKLAGQLRSALQNCKRQLADLKDRNANATIDELLGLL